MAKGARCRRVNKTNILRKTGQELKGDEIGKGRLQKTRRKRKEMD